MTEQITKTVQQIGNGGHIYLPKELVGQKIVISVISKSLDEIKEEILMIIKPHLKHVIGVYLYGSYARGEQVPGSDIDVLVITDGLKLKKRINEYEIVSMSIEGLEKTLESNAVLVLPILKEARAILNQQLIEKYRKTKLTKKNTKWYIETTSSSLKLAKYGLDDKEMMPNAVYPLIMRLRGLHMIECLILNRKYSTKEVDRYLGKWLSSDKIRQLNRMYRENRDDKRISPHSLDYSDISKLYNAVSKYFKKVKLLWEKLR